MLHMIVLVVSSDKELTGVVGSRPYDTAECPIKHIIAVYKIEFEVVCFLHLQEV